MCEGNEKKARIKQVPNEEAQRSRNIKSPSGERIEIIGQNKSHHEDKHVTALNFVAFAGRLTDGVYPEKREKGGTPTSNRGGRRKRAGSQSNLLGIVKHNTSKMAKCLPKKGIRR